MNTRREENIKPSEDEMLYNIQQWEGFGMIKEEEKPSELLVMGAENSENGN